MKLEWYKILTIGVLVFCLLHICGCSQEMYNEKIKLTTHWRAKVKFYFGGEDEVLITNHNEHLVRIEAFRIGKVVWTPLGMTTLVPLQVAGFEEYKPNVVFYIYDPKGIKIGNVCPEEIMDCYIDRRKVHHRGRWMGAYFKGVTYP